MTIMIPCICLGFNPYVAKNVSISESCTDYRWSSRGIWAIKGDEGWGLRDRYRIILSPKNNYREKGVAYWDRYFDCIRLCTQGDPLYLVGQKNKWGIYNILTHKYILAPKYKTYERINNSRTLFKFVSPHDSVYINTEKFIMGLGQNCVVGKTVDDVTKDSDEKNDFTILCSTW